MGVVLNFIKSCIACASRPIIYGVDDVIYMTCSNESCDKSYKTKGHKTRRGAIKAWNRGIVVPYFQ